MGKKILLTQEQFLQKLIDNNIKYTPLEEYKGANTKIKWMCYKNNLHIFEQRPSHIYEGLGCPYCSHQKVFVGETDLWTTHPEIASMLANQEDGYKYSSGSNYKTNWICKRCNSIIEDKSIRNVVKQGLSCDCSDGMSYSEKFLMSMLRQLNMDFIHDRPREWSNRKRYDFYIEKYNMIIECHGLQHYKEGFVSIDGARTLEEEQMNDLLKINMAISNGINEYIVLDCRKSEKEFIYNSILNSRLPLIFDLSNVDWGLCDEESYKSYYIDVLKYYNNGINSPVDIANKIGVDHTSVLTVLHKLTKNGLCNYNSKKSFKEIAPKKHYKKVICLETKFVYDAIKFTKDDGFEPRRVSDCCRNIRKTHGGYHWMLYDDYLKQINNTNNTEDNYGEAV